MLLHLMADSEKSDALNRRDKVKIRFEGPIWEGSGGRIDTAKAIKLACCHVPVPQ